ncbi:unnamed protein product [Rotaria socialis]|uniref:MULE transposase domain-containing protein n=1 Tax=Rotaria socialis TaxID=392032 RepID=A0A818CXG1_9BILA|nr:unnamed protein product [Rotaria socialis]
MVHLRWLHNYLISCTPFLVSYVDNHYHLFIVISGKSEEIYGAIFDVVMQHIFQRSISITTDYEKAVHNVTKKKLPIATVHDCFFHFKQCLWRQIKTLGLQKLFVDDRQVRWCLKTYACLALISEPSVIDEFQKITNFVDYYKGNFIGRQVRNQRRRAPRFPIAIWNCISRLDQQLPRTNNSNEGWHRAIHPGERIRQWILSNPMGSDSPMEPDRILERGPIVGSDGKNYFLTHDQISILCHQSTRVIFQSWIPLKSNIGSNTKDPTVGPCPGIP